MSPTAITAITTTTAMQQGLQSYEGSIASGRSPHPLFSPLLLIALQSLCNLRFQLFLAVFPTHLTEETS